MHKMNLLKTLKNIRLFRRGQEKLYTSQCADKRNEIALRCLTELNYPSSRRRKALLALNGIRITDLPSDQVSHDSLYKILERGKGSALGMEVFATRLNVKSEKLFPENDAGPAENP